MLSPRSPPHTLIISYCNDYADGSRMEDAFGCAKEVGKRSKNTTMCTRVSEINDGATAPI